MRNLTETLTSAQKAPGHVPYVKLKAWNTIGSLVRLDWSRLYTGGEDDYLHAVTMPADGSLVRVRVTLLADNLKLYRQRVTSPGPGSDFSQWSYTSQYGTLAVACASLGAEVSIFWIKNNREIRQMKSTDYGASWGSPTLLDYSPSTGIYGMAAAYKTNGDIALFYADQTTLYVIKRTGGSWGSSAAWDKSTGNLSGVATVHDGDWHLLVTGQDSSDNYHLWSAIYGDGDEITAGTWSDLKTVARAPSDGDFEYLSVFLDKPDVHRAFFIEKYGGTEAYQRPFWSHNIAQTSFLDNLWREPVPFNLSTGYGLAMAHHGDRAWLTAPYGVWRAKLTIESLDLSDDVISLREDLTTDGGQLEIELRNDDGRYAAPGTGDISLLDIGSELEFSPGYQTTAGNEASDGQFFSLEAYEHTSSPGKTALVLRARDAWHWLGSYRAGHQFRWNHSSDEMNVKEILTFVLSRVGLRLEVKSQSATATGFYPDFTIKPGDQGDAIVSRLLSFIPDVLQMEGAIACLINPQDTDSSDYSYGTGHTIFEGSYLKSALSRNLVEVEGYDPVGEAPIIVSVFDWDEIGRLYQRHKRIDDRNLDTVALSRNRGESYLREAVIVAGGNALRVPVNAGQQLYDVIEITDLRAGLDADKKRVLKIGMVYHPARARY
ncbi:MAG: hypothetical protein WC369_07485, partial [Dehalococcoidales bacterium]